MKQIINRMELRFPSGRCILRGMRYTPSSVLAM